MLSALTGPKPPPWGLLHPAQAPRSQWGCKPLPQRGCIRAGLHLPTAQHSPAMGPAKPGPPAGPRPVMKCETQPVVCLFYQQGQWKAYLGMIIHVLYADRPLCRTKHNKTKNSLSFRAETSLMSHFCIK